MQGDSVNKFPFHYGSNLYWFSSWGKRIEARLQQDNPIHEWDCAIFRPCRHSSKALAKYAITYSQVVRHVNDALDVANSHFENISDYFPAKQNDLVYALERLALRIKEASDAIGRHEKSKPTACSNFIEHAAEVLEVLNECERIQECYPLIRDIEPWLVAIFSKSNWPRCSWTMDGFDEVIATSHPTINDPREYRFGSLDGISSENDQIFRSRLRYIVKAWMRQVEYIAAETKMEVAESVSPKIIKWANDLELDQKLKLEGIATRDPRRYEVYHRVQSRKTSNQNDHQKALDYLNSKNQLSER